MPTHDETGTASRRFEQRRVQFLPDLYRGLCGLYDAATAREVSVAIIAAAKRAYDARSEELKGLDSLRERTAADWFQRPEMLGYMCYPDRFAGNFSGVGRKIPYLKELGVTYLHLLSVLKARPGDSDGGFAIADYVGTNEHLGSIEDLEALTKDLRAAGISLCIDFVFNHTAREHAWARRALAGEEAYQDFYFMYPDRRLPDKFEEFLEQVFPETAPGNFTYEAACDRWVWTTFYPYQWDLNYRNPRVLLAMLENIFHLANRGVEIFRFDAAIYTWKEPGTSCRSLPQTHALLQVFRAAMQVLAPGVALKAEAVAGARHIARYFGHGESAGKQCHLAYHTAAMAALWDCLAHEDVRPAVKLLSALPTKPRSTSWVYYSRCHDDIAWGTLADAQGADWGFSAAHLERLENFYAGETQGSFARGARFQVAAGAAPAGSNGTLASLGGLEAALATGNALELETAVLRVLLMHAVPLALDGVPLIYMGDERGLLNDYRYADEPDHQDGRWLHRPEMPEEAPKAGSPGARILSGVRAMVAARKALRVLHAGDTLVYVDTGNRAVLGFVRRGERGALVCLANFSNHWQRLEDPLVGVDIGGPPVDVNPLGAKGGADVSVLAPYQCRWLQAV